MAFRYMNRKVPTRTFVCSLGNFDEGGEGKRGKGGRVCVFCCERVWNLAWVVTGPRLSVRLGWV